ncbi:phage tail protein, partial [Yersinia wautersii]|uniref:phage tail protein n=1 Tax=Yersinia wautersii TaxID=1341643 RepID=UPI0009DF4036
MTAKFYALMTNLGAAKLANATALGTQLQITHMAVGDGGGVLPTPNPAQTQLIGEKRHAALNSLSIDEVNSSQIIAEQVIPETDGGWWIREIGLFDKDGILIAIANCPETYKPQLQEGSGRTQTVRMVLIVSSTEAVTLKIDPSVVLATRKYADDKAIEVRQYADKLLSEHVKSRNHPDATLSAKGFAQYSNATDSDSEKQAATSKAVNSVAKASVAAMSDHVQTDNPHEQYLQITKFLSEIKEIGPLAVAEVVKNLNLDSTVTKADNAFSRKKLVSVEDENGIAWNAPSGLYGAGKLAEHTVMIAHFNIESGSCPAFQLKIHYGNGGMYYRSARDAFGFERDWVRVGNDVAPVGIPMPWPLAVPPTGWLKCNGSHFDKSRYPQLAETYPSGILPDLR